MSVSGLTVSNHNGDVWDAGPVTVRGSEQLGISILQNKTIVTQLMQGNWRS